MGQTQSVSPRRFQEEYYLFFDETRGFSTPNSALNHHAVTGRCHGDESVGKGYVSQCSSDSKLVYRGSSDTIFNASTENDPIHGASSLSSGYSVSLDDEADVTPNRKYRNDTSASEVECTFREYQSPTGRVISGYWNGDEFLSGRITWTDGREYNGSLKGSVPDGYGAYRTSGGKEYTGYWRCGFQHGEGAYVTEKDGCRLQRRGVWENGQLVRWLDEDGIDPQDKDIDRTLLEEIMATPTVTPALSPSSVAVSSLPSVGLSPCAHMGGM